MHSVIQISIAINEFFIQSKILYFKEKNFVADMSICKTHPSDLQKFRTFLETTGSCITDDTLQDVKTILRGMFKMR